MQPGDTIGAFRIGRLLGRGGMASVYRATHQEDETPVALKVLHPGVAADGAQLEAFAFEVRAAASLDHPRITAIYDHGVTPRVAGGAAPASGGRPWLAMELVEGGPCCGRAAGSPGPSCSGRSSMCSTRAPTPTRAGSSIATSSQATCCSTPGPVGPS